MVSGGSGNGFGVVSTLFFTAHMSDELLHILKCPSECLSLSVNEGAGETYYPYHPWLNPPPHAVSLLLGTIKTGLN